MLALVLLAAAAAAPRTTPAPTLQPHASSSAPKAASSPTSPHPAGVLVQGGQHATIPAASADIGHFSVLANNSFEVRGIAYDAGRLRYCTVCLDGSGQGGEPDGWCQDWEVQTRTTDSGEYRMSVADVSQHPGWTLCFQF